VIIEKLLSKTQRTDLPKFAPGDTIRVQVKIKEGDKERLQAFEGVVISRSRGPQASFTVRKISFGQGVERIFPESSRVLDKVELVRSSKVRRAKLYYLRSLRGKAARLKDVERDLHRDSRLDCGHTRNRADALDGRGGRDRTPRRRCDGRDASSPAPPAQAV
jgi:large subunit ribosomal protein L19